MVYDIMHLSPEQQARAFKLFSKPLAVYGVVPSDVSTHVRCEACTGRAWVWEPGGEHGVTQTARPCKACRGEGRHAITAEQRAFLLASENK